MNRRSFLKICASLAGAATARPLDPAWGSAPFHRAYNRVLLTVSDAPLRLSHLAAHENYIFHYPFASTPCFLLNLGDRVAEAAVPAPGKGTYVWRGGVGPAKSIVAFTAICPHQLFIPDQEVTFILYHGPGQGSPLVGRDRVIKCCLHGSAFDPAAGGRLLQGPAELPLAAVELEWEPGTDRLFATAILGEDSFARFFSSFPRKRRDPVAGRAPVTPLDQFSRTVLRC